MAMEQLALHDEFVGRQPPSSELVARARIFQEARKEFSTTGNALRADSLIEKYDLDTDADLLAAPREIQAKAIANVALAYALHPLLAYGVLSARRRFNDQLLSEYEGVLFHRQGWGGEAFYDRWTLQQEVLEEYAQNLVTQFSDVDKPTAGAAAESAA